VVYVEVGVFVVVAVGIGYLLGRRFGLLSLVAPVAGGGILVAMLLRSRSRVPCPECSETDFDLVLIYLVSLASVLMVSGVLVGRLLKNDGHPDDR
jgi:hypothetical protein